MAGKKSKVVGISFKQDEAKEIEKRAASMNISTAHYCKSIIRDHMKSGKKLVLKER